MKLPCANDELITTDAYDVVVDAALILILAITAAGLEVQSTSDSHAYSVKLLPAGMSGIH